MWRSSVLPDLTTRRCRIAVLFDDHSTGGVAAAGAVAGRLGGRLDGRLDGQRDGRLDGRRDGRRDGRMECELRPVRPVDSLGGGAAGDPYGLTQLLHSSDVDAAVLIVPRRRGSRRLLPGPVVAGVPVGVLQADHCGQLPSALGRPDPSAPWVVAAMAKNVFLRASDDWATRLARVHPVTDLRADRARRDDLIGGLAAGPGVVLYAGHGSPRGWAGYQALRIEHVNDSPRSSGAAAGLVVAFACKTLARHRARWPFGSSLVETGAVRAYLAPATSVYTADAERLAEIVVDLLIGLDSRPTRVGDLMRLIEADVQHDVAARRAWATFRLIGDPLTLLV